MVGMSEADWEQLTLDTLGELGWLPLVGDKIAPARVSVTVGMISTSAPACLRHYRSSTPSFLRNTLHNRPVLSAVWASIDGKYLLQQT
jgi:hypothetical protein